MPDDEVRRFGIYRGRVADNADPQGMLRLRLLVPQVFESFPTGWALPVLRPDELGIDPPAVGSPVWVMFEAGDLDYPCWLGVWKTN